MRLSRQGFRTLLVCYNSHLAEDLRERLVAARVPLWDKLDVDHFHNLCLRLAHNFSIPIPKATNDADFYTRQLPTVLPQAARTSRARYDAIIVDEAQDFDPSWWQPLQALLHDREHGIWSLFFDDNQRLYDRPIHFPIDVPPYQLTMNCRTTRHIHTQIVHFYRPDEGALPPVAHGPQGRPVAWHPYDDQKEPLQQAVMALVHHLIEKEHILAREIAVLTPCSQGKSQLKANSLRPTQEITLCWSASAEGTQQVRLDTIHGFKGLERPVVILAEIERRLAQSMRPLDLARLLYVACSRAKHHLIVLLPQRDLKWVTHIFGSQGDTSGTREPSPLLS